jgi:hypothetical protein
LRGIFVTWRQKKLENFRISRLLNVKQSKKMLNVVQKSPNFPQHKTVKKKIIKEKKTTGMNVSKEEMNSTSKMLEVLGKRLYQV